MKIKLKNRIVSALLALAMVVSLIPSNLIPEAKATEFDNGSIVSIDPLTGNFVVKFSRSEVAVSTGQATLTVVPDVGESDGTNIWTPSYYYHNVSIDFDGAATSEATMPSKMNELGIPNKTFAVKSLSVSEQTLEYNEGTGLYEITITGSLGASFEEIKTELVNAGRLDANAGTIPFVAILYSNQAPNSELRKGMSISSAYSFGAKGSISIQDINVEYSYDQNGLVWKVNGVRRDDLVLGSGEVGIELFVSNTGSDTAFLDNPTYGTIVDGIFEENTDTDTFPWTSSGFAEVLSIASLSDYDIYEENVPAGASKVVLNVADIPGKMLEGEFDAQYTFVYNNESGDTCDTLFHVKVSKGEMGWTTQNIALSLTEGYESGAPTSYTQSKVMKWLGPQITIYPSMIANQITSKFGQVKILHGSDDITASATYDLTYEDEITIEFTALTSSGAAYTSTPDGNPITVTIGSVVTGSDPVVNAPDGTFTVSLVIAGGDKGTVNAIASSGGEVRGTLGTTTSAWGTFASSGLQLNGTDYTIEAKNNPGYRFTGWNKDGATDSTLSGMGPHIVKVVGNADGTKVTTYTATFVTNKVTVTVKENTDNDTKGKQVQLINKTTNAVLGPMSTNTTNGGVLEFSQVPNGTYEVQASLDGTNWTKVTDVEVKDNDKTATVQYWTVTVATDPADGSGGTAWIGAANAADKTTKKVTVLDGDDVTISSEAKTGYRFVEWTGTATLPGTTEDITDITTGPRTYTAKFEKIGLQWQTNHNPAQNSKTWTIGTTAPTWTKIIAEQVGTDGDIGDITYAVTGSVPGLKITPTKNDGVTITGTPSTAAGSPFTVTVTASAANGQSITQDFVITVNKQTLPRPTGTGKNPSMNNAKNGEITWDNWNSYTTTDPALATPTLIDKATGVAAVGATWDGTNHKWTGLGAGTYYIQIVNPDDTKYEIVNVNSVDITLGNPPADDPTITGGNTYERNSGERTAGTTYSYIIDTGNWNKIKSVSVGSGANAVDIAGAWSSAGTTLTIDPDKLDTIAGLKPGTLANGDYTLSVTFEDTSGLQAEKTITGGTLKVQTTYVVKFNAGDGAGESDVTVPADKKETVTTGNTAASFAYANATRPGYTLAGWSTNGHDTSAEWTSEKNYTPTTPATLEYTVYAVWNKNPITGDPQDFTGTVGTAFTSDFPVIQLAVEGISGFTYTHGSGTSGLPDLSAYGLTLKEDDSTVGRIIIKATTPTHATAGETAVPVTFTAKAENGATKEITFHVTVYKQTLTAPTLTWKRNPTAAGTATGAITMTVPAYPTGAGTITYTLDGPSTPPVTAAGDINGLLEGTYKVKATLTKTDDYKWATPITGETQSTWSNSVDLEDPGINRPTVTNNQTFEKNTAVTGRTSSFTFTFNTKDWTTVDKVQIGNHTLTENATTGYKVDYDAGTASATTNRTGTITVPVKVLDDLDPQLANGNATVTVTFGRTGGTADTQTDTATCTLKVQTTYIVSFADHNKGTLSPAIANISKTITDATIPTFAYTDIGHASGWPTKDGYQYAGWTTAQKETPTGPADWFSTTGKTTYTPAGTGVTDKTAWNTTVYATWTANVVTITVYKNGEPNTDKNYVLVKGTDVVSNGVRGGAGNNVITFSAVPEGEYSIELGDATSHTPTGHKVTAVEGATRNHDLHYYDVEVAVPVVTGSSTAVTGGKSWIGTDTNETTSNANKATIELLVDGTEKEANIGASITDPNYDFKTWSQEPSGGSFSDATSANDGKFTITSKNTTIKGPIVLTPEYQKSRYDVTITVNVDGVPTNGLTVELYDSAGTTLVDSQATAGSGVAAFHGRSNGTYTIKVKDGTTTYPGTESVTVKSDDAKKTVNAYSYIFVTNEPEAATQSASSMPTPFVSQKNNVTTAIDRTSAVVVLSTYTGVSATAPGLKGYGFSGWGVNDKDATTDLWDGSNRSLTTQTTFYAIWGADIVGLTNMTAKGALNLAGIIEQTGGAASGGGGGGTAGNYTYEVVSTEGLANDGKAHGITVTPLTDGSGSFTVGGTPDAVGDIKFTIKATSKLNGQSKTATLTVTVERTYKVVYAAPGATLDPAHNVLPTDSRVYTESGKKYGSTQTYSTITADTSGEPQWNNSAKGLMGWALTDDGTQEATFEVSTAKAYAAENGEITLYAVWSTGKLNMKNATLTAEYNMLKSQWDANKSGLCSDSSIDLTDLQVGGTDVAHWTFTVTDLPAFMVFDGAHTISMRPDDDATGQPKRVGDVVAGGYKIKVKLVDSGLDNAEATGTITLNVLKTTPVIVELRDKGGTHYAGDPTMDAMTYTRVVDPFESDKILSDDRDADIARWTVDDTALDAGTKTYNFTYTHTGTGAGNYNAATGPLELTAENRVISMTTGTKGDEDHYVKDYIDNTHFTTTQTYNPVTKELTVTVGVKNTSATSNIDTLTVAKTSGNAAVFSNPTSLLTSNNLNLAPNGVNNSVFTFKVQLGKTAVGEYEAKYTLTGKAGGTTSPATATATYTYKLKIGPALLDHATIAGLKVPTTGGTPTKLAGLSKTDSNKDLYTIESLTWAANDATFGAGKSYTATIVLKANPNYLFTVPNSKGETDCGGYQVTDDHATTTATLTGAATGNGTLSYGPDMASANSETVTLTYVFDPTASSGPVPVLTEKNYTTATLDKITATSTVPVDFYYVITDSAKKPSAADIIAGTGAVADATNASGKVTSGAANKGTVTWNAGITVTGLTPGTRYYVHVVACRAGTTSSPSPVGSDDALIPKYLKVNLHTGETAGTTSTVTASGTVLGGTTPVATPLNKDKDTTGALSMTGNGAFNPAPDIPTNELNNNTAWVFREVTVSTADDLPETGVTPGTAASTDPYTYNHGSAKAVTVVDITFRQRITGMPVVDTTSQAGHLVVTAGSTKIGDTTVTDAMLSSGKTGLTGATTTAGTDLEYVWEYKAVGASNWTALEAAYNPTTYNPTLPTDAAHAGAQYRVTVIYTGDDSLAGIHSSVQTGESGMTVELQRYQAANTVTYGTGVNRTPDEKGGGYYDASTSDTAKQMRMEGLKVIIRYTGAVTRTDEYVVGKDTLPEGLVWKGTGTVTVPANLTNFDIDFPSSGSTKISFTYGGQTSNTVDFRMNPKPLYYHTTDAAKLWDNSNNLGTNLLAPRVELNEGQIYVTDTTKGTDDVSLTGLTASDFQLSSSNVGVDYDVDIAPGSRSKLKLTGKQAGFYTLAPGYDTLCTTKGKGYITPRRVEVAQVRISGVEAGKDIAAAKASVTATDGLNGNHNKLTGNYPITWEILKDGGIPTNEDDWIRPEDDGNYNGKFQSNRQYRPTVQITADANHYLELNDNYVIRNLENNAWLKNGDPNTVVTVDSTGPNHPGLTEKLGHDVLYNNPGTFQTVYDLTITPELRFEDFGPNGHHHEPKTNLVHIEVVDQGASLGQYTVELGAYILSVWDVTMGTPSGDLIDMGATLTPEDRTGAHELTVDPDDKIRYTLDLSGVSTATAGTYMLTLTAKGSAEEGTLANDVQASYTFALVVNEPRVEPQPQPPSVEQSIIVLYWVSLKGKTNDLTGEKIPASGGRPTFVPKIIGLDGWVFKGWAETDPTLLKDGEKPELVDPLKIKLTSDKIYYAYYEKEEVDHVHFVRGYPDGTFRPDNYITRAEVATIIARSCLEGFEEGKDYGNPGGYSDIGTKRWYTSAISYCSMAGVFTGYPDGTFRPNDYITRQELALVVGRLAGLRVNMGLPFEDASSVNKWARDGVYTCYILGYVGGYNDGTFRPKNDITRAETVKIFNGYLNRGVDAKGLEGMTPFQLDASAGSYQINGTTEYLTWQDVPEKHWAYYEIIEASNDHDFHWPEDENNTSKKEAPPEDWDAVYIEAEWRYRATYAITWSVSEGTVAETTTKVALDKAPVAPEVTADEGRVFLGWALTEGGEVVDLTTIAITGAQTFYGIFADDGALIEPKTFTVSFETGEWADLDGESSILVEENGVLTTVPAAIAHEGYLFHGWSLTIGGEVIDPTTVIVTEDMTFFAVCEEKPAEPKSLTVTFLSGEQGDLTGETALTVEEGTFLTELPVVTAREGYVFAGWALTEGGAAVDPTQFAILEDTAFYALYTEQAQPEPEPEIPGTLYTIKAYIDGYEDGTFRPKEHITRATVASMIARAYGSDFDETFDYDLSAVSDITPDHWAAKAIGYCLEKGYFSGYPDGTFAPDGTMTRQEFAVVIAKLAGVQENQGLPFTDADSINKWARNYVYTVYVNGWITGYNDGTFKPKNLITRAEAVKIFNAFLGRSTTKESFGQVTEFDHVWSDFSSRNWAYPDIMEATNDHTYYLNEEGVAIWVDPSVAEAMTPEETQNPEVIQNPEEVQNSEENQNPEETQSPEEIQSPEEG